MLMNSFDFNTVLSSLCFTHLLSISGANPSACQAASLSAQLLSMCPILAVFGLKTPPLPLEVGERGFGPKGEFLNVAAPL